MNLESKKAVLHENWKNQNTVIKFVDYVIEEAYNDPNFFRWLFDEPFEKDFNGSISDAQEKEFKILVEGIS